MDKETIKRKAYQTMATIEDICSHGYVEPELKAYWLLNFLIAESFESYFSNFGYLPVDLDDAECGRQRLGFGSLTSFERDAICLLQNKVDSFEAQQYQRLKVVHPY